MSILSISFHSTPGKTEDWEVYMKGAVAPWAKNFCGEKRVLISEIESEAVQEGKNYNILLFFENKVERDSFFNEKIPLLLRDIQSIFGEEVILFPSKLNAIL